MIRHLVLATTLAASLAAVAAMPAAADCNYSHTAKKTTQSKPTTVAELPAGTTTDQASEKTAETETATE